ncbi:MAG: hypothetical protein Q9163_006106 [Psora crenata]
MSSPLLPPPQPTFVLRGHSAQIHALHFTPSNIRLLTADADGWVVSWNLAYMRATAAWRAHSNAILGLGSWGSDRVITHGRDNRLLVWQLGSSDEARLDKILPVDGIAAQPKQPWLLHALPVNALNFCPFAMCYDGMPQTGSAVKDANAVDPILIAVPNAIDNGGVDIFQLPSQKRAATIYSDRSTTTGMVMALNILAETTRIQVAAGFESGHTMVFLQADPGASFERLYCAQPHTQPVLSMAISPCRDHYVSSSADAQIAKHPLPSEKSIFKTDFKPIKISATKHAGQQGISYRSDGKIFATAGWDSAVRVYSARTLKEVAVLRWHKEGCYSTAFAAIQPPAKCAADDGHSTRTEESDNTADLAPKTSSGISSVQLKRDETARSTHWLVAGGKDGKVSLWNIY